MTAKQHRPTTVRTATELQGLYNDTLDALTSACDRFDRRDTREYRHVAAIVRNLCRDTRMSKSLLGQVGLKSRSFLTGSPDMVSGNKLAECHLIELLIRPNVLAKAACWQAVLDADPMDFVAFDDWWSARIVGQPDGTGFSRADLIGYVADQDGGVHVDPAIDAAFQDMRTQAFNYTDGRSTTDHVDRHVVRQIAHELLKSLRPSYRRLHHVVGAYSVMKVPRFVEKGTPQPVPLAGYQYISADKPCPCGSGLIFEECHRKGVSSPRKMEKIGGEFVAPPDAAYARIGFGVRPN